MDGLEQDVRYVKGIGPKKSKLLNKLGIKTLQDALYYFPRDYDIWDDIKKASDIVNGEECSLVVNFKGRANNIRTRRGLVITNWIANDDTGNVVCVWYNQPYRASIYKNSIKYFIRGKVEIKYGKIYINMPVVEEYNKDKHDGSKILSIYALTQGITQKDLRNLVKESLNKTNGQIIDYIPCSIRKKYDLVEKNFALANIHFPQSEYAMEQARIRLVFEEFFNIRLALRIIREQNRQNIKGTKFKWDNRKIQYFIQGLSFELTIAQKRVLQEILQDISCDKPMNRLIQGDVGSGKTILAAIALYCAYLSGYQGVMMVPTEILAVQHFESFKELFHGKGITIECLVGSMKASEKINIKGRLSEGDIDIIVATHAVLEEDVIFKHLGLIVTDEQHRFGVRQRAALQEKGVQPHMLVMSATPIPRTLSLILYGDLDISIIDELPPGRHPVKTYHVPSSMRDRVYNFVRRQVQEGRQVYVVCPLVEQSEKIDSVAAVELFERLKNGPLTSLRIDLLHGRMKGSEKDRVMEKFSNGDIDVLVSTTVIEVGVNVPNATLMVIENAERFGLAQLHQLRGRVGRGKYQSYCVLITDVNNFQIRERMQIMTRSNNGFDIAEKDLQLRGPGDMFGVRQHGLPEFRIANLFTDMEILKRAQQAVDEILNTNYDITYKNLIDYVMHEFDQKTKKIAMN
ncbi:MAG: ATP-dependent DNA helicase RecG [Xylanivirga thermophila]|jgi:ATP-dependent DNA helicase RecG|uniref:ATP-dependent DNA helicase RecG n=1 Tax=Xylanivirga thermophila TaxID=2496273 RepID=UPI00101C4968|nr:ATP-dependent DNA helicase RecG [Xylanivirga thermophila]